MNGSPLGEKPTFEGNRVQQAQSLGSGVDCSKNRKEKKTGARTI